MLATLFSLFSDAKMKRLMHRTKERTLKFERTAKIESWIPWLIYYFGIVRHAKSRQRAERWCCEPHLRSSSECAISMSAWRANRFCCSRLYTLCAGTCTKSAYSQHRSLLGAFFVALSELKYIQLQTKRPGSVDTATRHLP